MKPILSYCASVLIVLSLLVNAAMALEPASIASETQTNTLCPVSSKPVNPAFTVVYEGRTWSFAEETCKAKWEKARAESLYQQLGGKAAINAAVDAFYVKVLADERVKHFFDDVSMEKQRRKQKEFLSAALGGPLPWVGKDMRKAHADIEIKEEHFNAIAENLVATLKDLKISDEMIGKVIAVVATTKDDVLNCPKKAE
ncbi:MAG: group 1 truncated hemoglobin [Verrucomicrobiota bacterium]